MALVVKNPPANGGDTRDTGSIPESGRSLGGGHGNPLQYFCLENPMDRSLEGYSPWGCKESDTTEQLSMHICSEQRELGLSNRKHSTHPFFDVTSVTVSML